MEMASCRSNYSSSNLYHVASPKSKQPDVVPQTRDESKADILVAGSVAIDLSCDYSAPASADASPVLNTSNPACISQSIGGVGHNVALAAHSVSKHARVRLCSMVGDDV